MFGIHQCPHCGKDKRNSDEIAEDIKDFLEEFDDELIGEFDWRFLKDTIIAALQLKEIKLHSTQITKLDRIKEILDQIVGELDEYESNEDESNEDEKNVIADKIISLQKDLKKELIIFVSNIQNRFFDNLEDWK